MEILRDQNPLSLFQNWLREAAKTEPNDPEAMALATVSPDGMPSVRMVLLKSADQAGFRFFTNMESRKAGELHATARAAAVFHWKSLLRQVRVEGRVEKLPRTDVEVYFATRHPLSKLGAWASRQSQPLDSRDALVDAVADVQEKFKGQDVPCPPHWGGYIIVPEKIEFWQQGDGRLHDRFLFTRKNNDDWDLTRLYP
jgi:pyridoxamine 5'-phosphate oxidase